MESIDKLHRYIRGFVNVSDEANLLGIADEIEHEVSERYMLLPVDAEGVPIHLWDEIQFENEHGGTGCKVEVCAVSDHYAYYGEGKHFYKASMCRHVKPRTIEDVLRECCNEWNKHCGDEWESGVYAKYADELRSMGVDE